MLFGTPRRQAARACAALLLAAAVPGAPCAAAADRAAPSREELSRGSQLLASSPAAALAHLKRAYTLAHAGGLDSVEAAALLRIGQVELGRDVPRARIVLRAALPLWRAHQDSTGASRTLAALAEADRRQGRLAGAVALLEQAARAAPGARERTRLFALCAALDTDLDDPIARGRHLESQARAAQAAGDPQGQAQAVAARAQLLGQLGAL
ncbi:MAG TPA: hypothetical protein VMS93_09580, partial [Candidatus Saccharimonadales bacterium]|nr:hypothetical protein [Candidatus Saccharimonadales bacterium]